MTNEEKDVLIAELLVGFGDLKIKLGRIGNFNTESVKQAYEVITEVIKMVEEYSDKIKALTGSEKKDLAVTAINKIVDIPFIPEFVEGALIGWSIDLAVELLNKVGGQDWLTSLFGDKEPVVEDPVVEDPV